MMLDSNASICQACEQQLWFQTAWSNRTPTLADSSDDSDENNDAAKLEISATMVLFKTSSLLDVRRLVSRTPSQGSIHTIWCFS